MIVALIALSLLSQQMTQEEMISEGEQIGRTAAAMGTCQAVGYDVDAKVGEAWAAAYSARASEAGWSQQVTDGAIDAGVAVEATEMRPPEFDRSTSDSQLIKSATAYVAKVKDRCRRLHAEHADFIDNLDQGDRNADAQLAIMLRGLER